MTAIGPGTPLICIDDSKQDTTLPRQLILHKDALYFCAVVDFEMDGACTFCGCSGPGIQLRGKEGWFPDGSENEFQYFYCPSRFRPLNDGDTSLVDAENRQRQYRKIINFSFNYGTRPKLPENS